VSGKWSRFRPANTVKALFCPCPSCLFPKAVSLEVDHAAMVAATQCADFKTKRCCARRNPCSVKVGRGGDGPAVRAAEADNGPAWFPFPPHLRYLAVSEQASVYWEDRANPTPPPAPMNSQESHNLSGKRVAILCTDGFEESELLQPRAALQEAGAETVLVSPQRTSVKSWTGEGFGQAIPVDLPLESANAESFDALLLPGGVINPDRLRTSPAAVDFVRAFFDAGKPVAAICHGPQILIDADVITGRRLTSYQSIRRDLINAGATWVDEEVVVDQGLVTSRRPSDIPAFNRKLVEEVAEGVHAGQHT
jgi:protease I